jgi:hypothetical protein
LKFGRKNKKPASFVKNRMVFRFIEQFFFIFVSVFPSANFYLAAATSPLVPSKLAAVA